MRDSKKLRAALEYITSGQDDTTRTMQDIQTECLIDMRDIMMDIAKAVGVPFGTFTFPEPPVLTAPVEDLGNTAAPELELGRNDTANATGKTTVRRNTRNAPV